ncbi:MAG: hypothetical protein HZC02_04730 [Candidatus Levybacteria bacterium]|nr:hypothetical protein [Candidatus Levybacteria bacterium]
MSKKIASKSLPENLKKQVHSFIKQFESYNEKRQFPRDKKDYLFLEDFFIQFIKDRNRRADEVSSVEYKKVRMISNAQFPSITLWNLCMDGRVLAVLMNGASAGVGSSIRVPGGLLREFVYGENGNIFLLENSNYAFVLNRALKKFGTKKIFEIYDSHVGCAARKAEEMAHGKLPNDAGLLQDVIYKKQMADATVHFIKEHFDNDFSVTPIQTSFDPHNGFMYMGLETDKALSYARKTGNEYTDEVLKKLVEKRLIISTEDLIKRTDFNNLFAKYSFSLDWKSQYLQSAKQFWITISKIKIESLPLIKKELLAIYPHLSSQRVDMQDELAERAMLILTNAYSGFLSNNMQQRKKAGEHYHYPFGVHREEGVKVSEGGYPPYDISMFVVFSLDNDNLPANIELAATLVRNNRRDGRVLDRSGTYSSPQEFAEAPVPVVIQEIVREKIDEKEWERLSQIDWSDLPKDWESLSTKMFFEYLQKKANMPIGIANAINSLRERMLVLYNPQQPTSGHLIQNFKIALPIIVGSNRRNFFVIPFLKLGFQS